MTALETAIECVLFDLDGTLIDTAADFVLVLNSLMDEEGITRIDPQRIGQTVSDGARGLIRLGFGLEQGAAEFERLLQRLLDLYYQQLLHTQAALYPGLDELLEKFSAAGILWGIVTNKPEKYSLRLLEQLGLSERCNVLVCPDHVTNRKPHPEPLFLACEKLSCDRERTVYVGDHIRDMQAAKNADLIAIAAAYGYLGENDRIEEWNADFVIRNPNDLEGLLGILKFA
ncbi:MAG: HAD-IA family hydrolase [Pseudohongiellaceae bacterium]